MNLHCAEQWSHYSFNCNRDEIMTRVQCLDYLYIFRFCLFFQCIFVPGFVRSFPTIGSTYLHYTAAETVWIANPCRVLTIYLFNRRWIFHGLQLCANHCRYYMHESWRQSNDRQYRFGRDILYCKPFHIRISNIICLVLVYFDSECTVTDDNHHLVCLECFAIKEYIV